MDIRITVRNHVIIMPLLTLAAITIIAVGAVAAVAVIWSGSVSSGVKVTSTAVPVISITEAYTFNGTDTVYCIGSSTSLTCPGVDIGQAASYTITVDVQNSGLASAPVTVSAACVTSCLSGSSVALTTGSATQTLGPGNTIGNWIFTYSAGQTTGSDTVTVSASAT